MKKWLLIGLVIMLLVSLGGVVGCGPATVTFPDPNLEAVIREAIGKAEGPILTSDLEILTSLDALEKDINDLTGLEYCISLTELINLGGEELSNISPLASLTNLTKLHLNAPVSDISALASLTDLTELEVLRAQISDISVLASLINLTHLGLMDNEISDISPLAELTNLTSLMIAFNPVKDISPLSSLTNLKELIISHTLVSDISPLASLTNLTKLQIWFNQISDISPLVKNSGLSDGDYVNLMNNPLSTTSVNVYIPELQERGVEVSW